MDPILEFVYKPENCHVFADNEVILFSVFNEKSQFKTENDFQLLSKSDFYQIMNEIGMTVLPKVVAKKDDEKGGKDKGDKKDKAEAAAALLGQPKEPLFGPDEIFGAIANTQSFDSNYLDYFDFLEALVRVTLAKPWSADKEDIPFNSKLQEVINKIDDRYGDKGEDLVKRYKNVRQHMDQQCMYQPRVVRDDDAEDDEDEGSDDN